MNHFFRSVKMTYCNLRLVLIAVLSVGVLALFWNFEEVSSFSTQLSLSASEASAFQLPTPSVLLQPKLGLGNQLFEYACTYALARKLNFPLYVRVLDEEKAKSRRFGSGDRPYVLDLFKIPLSPDRSVTSSWKVGKVIPLSDQDLLSHSYDSLPDLDQLSLTISGYCQGQTFFSRFEEELLPLFEVRDEFLSSRNYSEMSEKIRLSKCSICMHIRRGDFPNHRRMPVSFYQEAMVKMDKMLRRRNNVDGCENPKYFLFSDNLVAKLKKEFGEKFFLDLQNYEMVSGQGLTSIEEFKLMSECDHNIIPASSFGWWAAYLNKNPEKVVVAGHYHPKMFEIEKSKNAEYLTWQYRYVYYPVEWVVIDPFRNNT